jgi:catechol 2,3-dioxygenase-like lactoylglutathione lyase family enzyme
VRNHDDNTTPESASDHEGSEMSIEYVFAGLSVSRLDAAIDWYERLLGRPPDILPNEREAMWQLAATASVYLVADESRAGRGRLTVFVGDLDQELAAIAGRGIAFGEIEAAAGLFRKTVITDPDGNEIQLGQNLSAERKEQPADA